MLISLDATELFFGWFKQFVEISGITIDRPVLLLLDGHSTPTKNIDLINGARSREIIICALISLASY